MSNKTTIAERIEKRIDEVIAQLHELAIDQQLLAQELTELQSTAAHHQGIPESKIRKTEAVAARKTATIKHAIETNQTAILAVPLIPKPFPKTTSSRRNPSIAPPIPTTTKAVLINPITGKSRRKFVPEMDTELTQIKRIYKIGTIV